MEGVVVIILLLFVAFLIVISNAGEKTKAEPTSENSLRGNPMARISDALSPMFAPNPFDKVDWGNVSLAEIKRIVESGADVNIRGKMLKTYPNGGVAIGLSNSPLDFASTAEIAEYLIEQGADVNSEDNGSHTTPLHYSSSPEVVDVLLRHGADINHKNKDGETPLISALTSSRFDVAEHLVERGADINVIEKKTGKTPLCFFVSVEFNEKLLKMGANPNVVVEEKYGKYSPLHYAAIYGYTDHAQLLIDYGADVNSLATGKAPLCSAQSPEMVNFLLDNGADIEIKDDKQETPLFYAVFGDVDVVQALVKRGANIHALDKSGNTILHYQSDPKVTTYLLMHGLDPNARNNRNETPLHNAVIDSNLDEENLRDSALEIIRVLLEYGANVSIKNDFGETPIDVANSEDIELIELLKSHL